MDWIKIHYDRALLGLMAVVLIVCAIFAAWSAMHFSEAFAERNSSKPPDNTIVPSDLKSLETAASLAASPNTWSGHDGSLFVSRPYVLKDTLLVDPLEGGQQLHPPLENAWLIRYNLDYADPEIKSQDPDKDRFSNLEEFVAGSDPTNDKSLPPFYTKLRLAKFTPKAFRLKFSGTPDEGQTFTINTKDLGGRTQFLKIGDMIDGAPYKILGYAPKQTTRNEMEVDVSELTIENTGTGQKITLVYDKEADDPTSFGEFAYLWDDSKFIVKKDDTFSLPPETDKKYKLIDISAVEAQIQDIATGQIYKIGKP